VRWLGDGTSLKSLSHDLFLDLWHVRNIISPTEEVWDTLLISYLFNEFDVLKIMNASLTLGVIENK